MMKFIIHFLFFFWIGSISSFAQNSGYLWPTEASPYLSSTFGETRAAHFHSGLDIKTWGREGYKVFASKSGRIYRMAISAKGYGRVLYLQHEDSTFTVYAHLQRFTDQLQQIIDSVRLETHSFEVDLYMDSLSIYVERGEVIGYSGSTGIGPPHLHFEIRDKYKRPFNALLSNLNVPDAVAPTISALMVFPLSDSTTIRGSYYPQVFYPSKTASVDSMDFGLIEATGTFGIAVSTYDGANQVTNRYAVYELGLFKGTESLFYQRLDAFDFEEAETMFQDRLPAPGAYRRSFQTLFKKDGPPIPFHKSWSTQSAINPTPQRAEYTLIVNDIYGNRKKAGFRVQRSNQQTALGTNTSKPVYEWYWESDWIATSPTSRFSLKNPENVQPLTLDNSQFLFEHQGTRLQIVRIPTDSITYTYSLDRNLKVGFLPHTFFDTLSIALQTGSFEGSPYIAVHPATHIARKNYQLIYYLGDDFTESTNYQYYRIDRKRDRLIHEPSELIGRTLHAFPDQLGEFLILADNEPPEVSGINIRQTSYGKWLVELSVFDEQSGINYKESELMVNGVPAITEYDFEEDLLIYYHPDFRPLEENRIDLVIKDNAGNATSKVFYK